MAESVEIVEVTPVRKNNPTVVTGFTGSGFIGNTALMYIIRQKRFPLRATVKSHLIPPMMLLIEGKPTPVFRIYSDEKGKVLYVLSEALISAENAWTIGIELIKWFRSKGVKEFIFLDGMPFSVTGPERPVFGFTTTGEKLEKYGVKPTNEGGISGLNAVLLDRALEYEIPWTTFLVPTSQSQMVDYGGAAVAIEVLNKIFKLGVNTEPLKKSNEFRRKMMGKDRREKRGFLDSLRKRRSGT
ncbi:MAG: PAC2 family protein [Candidatus Bathyarchaeota archaeon]|jgi:predicted ATP-grasp superfamily ATP-dependent carboligase